MCALMLGANTASNVYTALIIYNFFAKYILASLSSLHIGGVEKYEQLFLIISVLHPINLSCLRDCLSFAISLDGTWLQMSVLLYNHLWYIEALQRS